MGNLQLPSGTFQRTGRLPKQNCLHRQQSTAKRSWGAGRGQVPCALACSVVASKLRRQTQAPAETVVAEAPALAPTTVEVPETPDYQLFDPPFGQGAYGKVWLARNAIGQWQALKAVYLARF